MRSQPVPAGRVLCVIQCTESENGATRTTTLWDLCGCGIVWAHRSPWCLVRAGGAAYARRPSSNLPRVRPPFIPFKHLKATVRVLLPAPPREHAAIVRTPA